MGGAASSVSTNLRLHHLTKDQLIPEVQDLIVFEKHADPSGHITVDKLLHVLGEKTDVYIAHDHSMDRETLSRCAKVNSYLQSKGLLTFFAEGRLLANKSLLAKGIENASLILVCITPGYMENASIAGELCSFEFDYATRHKAHRMLPLVFDSNLRSPVDWTGPISTFASAVFVDLSSPVPTADAMDQLLVRVMGLLGRPLHVLMEDQAHALSSDHSVVYPADKVPDLPQAAGLPFGPIPRGGLRGSATTGTAATADASGAAQAHAHAHAQDHSPTHSTHSYEHAHGHGHGHSGSPTHTTLVNGVHVTHYAETEPIIVTPRHPGEPFDWDALLASLSGMDQRNDPAMELITALITDPLAVNRRMHYRSDAHATEHRWTLLQWAVHVHNVLVIDALLAVDGIDPNLTEDAQTPLCMAAVRGYEDTVERLVKVKDIDLNAVDKDGCTALVLACMHGHLQVCMTLLEHTVDLTVVNKSGWTALHFACALAVPEAAAVVKRLLQKGADPNALSFEQLTPLQVVCQKGSVDALEVMIKSNLPLEWHILQVSCPLFSAPQLSAADDVQEGGQSAVQMVAHSQQDNQQKVALLKHYAIL